MTTKPLKEQVLEARPDAVEIVEKQRLKADSAQMLRELRKSAGLTQMQVAEASGLDQSVISKMESPLGALPGLLSFHRYVSACNGHMVMGVSAAPITEDTLSSTTGQPVFAMGF
ncbi:MAG: helix-turn-helix transcriptional regulator [Silicimonas sp.]|nr:helix-turn-helix transcriptional regulator [Silicimonas sp.]